jgi:hypothetical protein
MRMTCLGGDRWQSKGVVPRQSIVFADLDGEPLTVECEAS